MSPRLEPRTSRGPGRPDRSAGGLLWAGPDAGDLLIAQECRFTCMTNIVLIPLQDVSSVEVARRCIDQSSLARP